MDPSAFLKDRARPPSAETLGWTLLELDVEAMRIRVGYDGKPEFRNPGGVIQGGFQAAMLDDAMGPLVMILHEGRRIGATTDLHATFLRPVPPGPIEVAARVVRAGRAMMFLEGELFDREGRLCARASGSFFMSDLKPG